MLRFERKGRAQHCRACMWKGSRNARAFLSSPDFWGFWQLSPSHTCLNFKKHRKERKEGDPEAGPALAKVKAGNAEGRCAGTWGQARKESRDASGNWVVTHVSV